MFCIGHSPSNAIEVSREETEDLDDNICDDEYEDDEEEGTSSCLDNFFQAIEFEIRIHSSVEGDRLNAYYVPDVQVPLMKICKKFPMWTNLMVGFFKSPYLTATSAAIEGEFSQLKNSILRHESRPLSVDRFVVTHLRSIENMMKIARSEQLFPPNKSHIDSDLEEKNRYTVGYTMHESPNYGIEEELERSTEDSHILNSGIISSPRNVLSINYSSSSSDDSLNKEESWRGLKNIRTGPFKKSEKRVRTSKNSLTLDKDISEEPVTKNSKKRRTKYLEACPEIERILSKTCTRSSKTVLLRNGNLTTPCSLNKKKYIISNTCAFDSLVFGIAMACTDFPSYHSYINSKNIEFLNFIVEIANHGSSAKMYNSRLKLLNTIFTSESCVDNVHLINAECNVSLIINGLLKEVPSCIENISCSNQNCRNYKKIRSSPTILMNSTDGVRVIVEGISILPQVIEKYVNSGSEICMLPNNSLPCGGQKNIERKLQKHIFIELDSLVFQADNILSCQLTDIPQELSVDNKQ